MRISEVTTLDEGSYFHDSMEKELEKKGYTFLKSGVDQEAWIEPGSDCILKIFGCYREGFTLKAPEERFTKGQKMFFKFADFCTSHPDNPFLPKFFGYETFDWEGEVYIQIRQERLVHNNVLGKAVEMIGHLIHWKRIPDADTFLEVYPREWNNNYDQRNIPIVEEFIHDLGYEKFKLLFNTLKVLQNMGEDNHWLWDLHLGNVMFRADNTPVCVDPWVTG